MIPSRDASEAGNGSSQLIGTSKEREEYRNKLALEVAASLKQDQAKDAINKEIVRAQEEGAQLERLRRSRSEESYQRRKKTEVFYLLESDTPALV